MFKCCVCNKSLKKEKASTEAARLTPKHSQKGADTQVVISAEGNGDIPHTEKLNGDVQKPEKLKSPTMEKHEDADDLITKSPAPSGKREENPVNNSSINSTNDPKEKHVSDKNEEESTDKTENVVEDIKVKETCEKSEEGPGSQGSDDSGKIENSEILDSGGAGDRGGGKQPIITINANVIPMVIRTNHSDSLCDGFDEEGDDSVFESSPSASKKKPTVSAIPRWLSEEEDGEHDSEGCSGMQEPPATPVARDELALKRHRFFSDLLHATQNGSEHRVRFDPLGPMVHSGCEASDKEDQLEELVTRLENVTKRLEKVRSPSVPSTQETAVQTSTPSPKRAKPSSTSTPLQRQVSSPAQLPNKGVPTPLNMSSSGYEDLVAGRVSEYLRLSEKIGGDVATHSKLVEQAFRTQLQFIQKATKGPQPANQSEQVALLAPTSSQIQKIQEFRESNRGSKFFNHLSAISESIPALGWVAVAPTPAPYVKEMNDAGQFYTNRVLKDWKEKDKIHVEWCKAWVQTLTDLQQYVRQHHTTGLVWGKSTGGPAPPAGIPPPPPPSMPMMDAAPVAVNDERSALFAEINQGSAITKNLKKVTSEMQTHKNPNLRTGPAPFKTPVGNAIPTKSVPPANAPIDKPPVFTKDGKKWLVEYHKGNKELLIDNVEMNNVVYMFRCHDSTLVVKGKINSVVMDSCRKSSVVFDSVVASMEFVNCQSVQMQVLGKVPTISIDKTDGCQMYLNSQSMDVEIITSKSSEMNVMVPKGTEDYAEYPVPEQFKTTISPKGLSTIAVDSLG